MLCVYILCNPADAPRRTVVGAGSADKGKKKKKAKLTIWEKYELHKQFVKEMKDEAEKVEAEEEEAQAVAKAAAEDSGEAKDEEARAAPVARQPDYAPDAAKNLEESKSKKTPVLPWMRVPITIEGGLGTHLEEVRGLDPRLMQALQTNGMVELFPVQAALWNLTAGGHSRLHDVCLCAPTGSGKTLAYAIPMAQSLSRYWTRRLRGLILAPTRDLAQQVFDVFCQLAPAVGLSCGLMAGKDTIKAEAAMLVREDGSSGVDILIATPGRLMSHIQSTEGFTLHDVQFLVVDEADRLLRQSYHEWLPTVLESTPPRPDLRAAELADSESGVLKMIVSATLTQDPSKIERLQLHCPRFIAVSAQDYRYKLPRELQEHKVMCEGAEKPLVLVALLNQLVNESTVVFTASVEATHRLWLMLDSFTELRNRAVEYSSHVSGVQRQASLSAFRNGQSKILVASDAMTRGMDVAGITAVVNYDTPVYSKTYVHRAGRTARAGRQGKVFTLLRYEDMRHFKSMLRKADNTFVRDYVVEAEYVDTLRPQLEGVLDQVKSRMAAEASGQTSMSVDVGAIKQIVKRQAEKNLYNLGYK
uniref:RNA helicase n=1 Tax=Tetraselmis chuii TaxID=63592 RepID=A0A7S1T4D8_9CHLO|mmetsp:Transcript_4942/g.8971  ORF Transcript_4942/g.8971 Transcript_4942/m.8971 type:complete len:587 (+) Transcript_4942:385-2145(+)